MKLSLILLALALLLQAEPVPEEALSWFRQGEALIGTEKQYSEEQAGYFRKALDVAPDFAPALFNLALIESRRERFDEAVTLLTRLLAEDPSNSRALSLRAETYMRNGQLSDAGKDVEALKEVASEEPGTWQLSGRLRFTEKRPEEAVVDFRKALDLDPEAPDLQLDMAMALDRSGQSGEAATFYKLFLGTNPSDAQANRLLAKCLIRQDRFEEALPFLRTARHSLGSQPDLDQDLAYVLLRLHQLEEAENLLRKGKKESGSLFNLGLIALEQGRLVDAELNLRRAALRDPDNAVIWATLGDLFSNGRRTAEALQAYRKAVQLGADDFQTRLHLGIAEADSGQIEEARHSLEEALRINPESAEARFALGIVYERLQEENLALAQYEAALGAGLSDGRLHFRLAVLYSKRGLVDRSLEQLARALELDHEKYLPVLEAELRNVESDLDPIRYTPEFAELLRKYESHAEVP